jgi:hypothetical protein
MHPTQIVFQMTKKGLQTFNNSLHIVQAITKIRDILPYLHPALEFPFEEIAFVERQDHGLINEDFRRTNRFPEDKSSHPGG